MANKKLMLGGLLITLVIAASYFYSTRKNLSPALSSEIVDIAIDSDSAIKPIETSAEKVGDASTALGNQDKNTLDVIENFVYGLLIDNNNQSIAGGDIIFFTQRNTQTKECEQFDHEEQELNNHAQLVSTDDNGGFVLPIATEEVMADQCLILYASKPGYETTVVGMETYNLQTQIEVELQKQFQIGGVVVTPLGSAQTRAEILYWPAVQNYSLDNQWLPCETIDPDSLQQVYSDNVGNFRLTVIGNGDVCVRAQHGDWASSDILKTSVNTGENLRLTLRTPLSLRGHVADLDGLPLEDFPLLLVAAEDSMKNTNYHAQTNSAGEFIIPAIDVGDFILQSNHPNYAIAEPREIQLSANEGINMIEVKTFPLTTITGQIVNIDNNPVSGVRVSVRSPYLPSLSTTSTVSNDEGHFILSSEHQSKKVRDALAMASEFSESNLSVFNPSQTQTLCLSFDHPNLSAPELELNTLEPQLELNSIVLTPADLTIRGHVLNHRGEGTKAVLEFQWLDNNKNVQAENTGACANSAALKKVYSNDDGVFMMSVQKTGKYSVKVVTDRYIDRKLTITIDDDKELLLNIQ